MPVNSTLLCQRTEDPVTHIDYAEKWCKRKMEAYRIANSNSLSSSAQAKTYYDQRGRGVVLNQGDWVLVRNLGERAGPGKLYSKPEKGVYMVKEQISEFGVCPPTREHLKKGETRQLHRILHLLVNDLPVEFQSQSSKSPSEPSRRQGSTCVRVN